MRDGIGSGKAKQQVIGQRDPVPKQRVQLHSLLAGLIEQSKCLRHTDRGTVRLRT